MSIDELIHQILSKPEKLAGKTVGLIGGLGAGKTYFVKNMLESYDPQFSNQVSSPTFTLCNLYSTPQLKVRHFDFYRLKNREELEEIGFFESLNDEQELILIEWVDLFEEIISFCDFVIQIDMDPMGKHEFFIHDVTSKQ